MISYEIASVLRRTGWQFKSIPADAVPPEVQQTVVEMSLAGFCSVTAGFVVFKGENTIYQLPTLEELIEACGATMFAIRYVGATDSDGTWIASKDIYRGELPVRVEAQELSIKAAVGRLWLILNKKS